MILLELNNANEMTINEMILQSVEYFHISALNYKNPLPKKKKKKTCRSCMFNHQCNRNVQLMNEEWQIQNEEDEMTHRKNISNKEIPKKERERNATK